MNTEELVEKLASQTQELLEESKAYLPADSVDWASNFLKHGEEGLAAESLLEYFEEHRTIGDHPELTSLTDALKGTLRLAKEYNAPMGKKVSDQTHYEPNQHHCLVCGYLFGQDYYPWGEDGKTPLFDICPCCGVEFGYGDASPKAILRTRRHWQEQGMPWFKPEKKPSEWDANSQLSRITLFS